MKSEKQILIDESGQPGALVPLTRIRSFAEIRNGIYTTAERLHLQYPHRKLFFRHDRPDFTTAFHFRNPLIFSAASDFQFDDVIAAADYTPWKLIGNIDGMIESDLVFWKKLNKSVRIPSGVKFRGRKKDIFIHQDADIFPGVVIDATSGPVVIDSGAVVKPFTFLEGPLYIGRDARIDNAKIGGSSVIGHSCRIGGEVENSIVGDFSNKHHEGFLGHSIIGRWVNLGALATTSDLKNNYGIVKIKIGDDLFSTETIKFGSVIGDYVKIAIGVMLNTGTVIDFGSNILAERVNGYLPPFLWPVITDGQYRNEKYRLDKFIADAKTVMLRREISLSAADESLIQNLFQNS